MRPAPTRRSLDLALPVLPVLPLITWAILLLGCGSPEPACPVPVASGCSQPRGTYEKIFIERAGGTCGPLKTRYIPAVDPLPTHFNAPCSGTITRSDDLCSGSFEV